MRLRKIIGVALLITVIALTGACSKNNNKVIIYSSAEDYRNEHYLKRLKEQFPQYDIVLDYLTTGNHAAKLRAEGTRTEADITLSVEYGYLEQVQDLLADLSKYDTSKYVDDLVVSNKFLPELRNSGAIIVNTEVLKKKGLAKPKSYQDLLKPAYKGLISMPSPKSSGTGYMFLKNLVNTWGEDKAFEYFGSLAKNILQFTSSGSGPVNALVQGEVAIGLGMTAQAVTAINDAAPLEIMYFAEGAPYSAYGYGIIKGKEKKKAVREIFEFLDSTLIAEDSEKFFPEQIYKDKVFAVKNYPTAIPYGDMSNNTPQEKERLLAKWTF